MRRACADALLAALPAGLKSMLFATTDAAAARVDVENSLDRLFGDEHFNRHLVVRVVEAVAMRVFPELGMDDTWE